MNNYWIDEIKKIYDVDNNSLEKFKKIIGDAHYVKGSMCSSWYSQDMSIVTTKGSFYIDSELCTVEFVLQKNIDNDTYFVKELRYEHLEDYFIFTDVQNTCFVNDERVQKLTEYKCHIYQKETYNYAIQNSDDFISLSFDSFLNLGITPDLTIVDYIDSVGESQFEKVGQYIDKRVI